MSRGESSAEYFNEKQKRVVALDENPGPSEGVATLKAAWKTFICIIRLPSPSNMIKVG